jgi:hypothetical protein
LFQWDRTHFQPLRYVAEPTTIRDHIFSGDFINQRIEIQSDGRSKAQTLQRSIRQPPSPQRIDQQATDIVP